jgi:hypothetical protein
MLPSIVAQAQADRAFLGRAIRYLVGVIEDQVPDQLRSNNRTDSICS